MGEARRGEAARLDNWADTNRIGGLDRR